MAQEDAMSLGHLHLSTAIPFHAIRSSFHFPRAQQLAITDSMTRVTHFANQSERVQQPLALTQLTSRVWGETREIVADSYVVPARFARDGDD